MAGWIIKKICLLCNKSSWYIGPEGIRFVKISADFEIRPKILELFPMNAIKIMVRIEKIAIDALRYIHHFYLLLDFLPKPQCHPAYRLILFLITLFLLDLGC